MKRPLYIWTAFAACLAVVLGALAWVTRAAVVLDRTQRELRGQASLEENVRLALWRMDSSLATLIAQENARPYFAYGAFYPAGKAYTRMFAEIKPGDVLMPSPLLGEIPPERVLHFQIRPDGEVTSPEAPTGQMRKAAEAAKIDLEKVDAAGKLLDRVKASVKRDAILSTLPTEKTPLADMYSNVNIDRQFGGPSYTSANEAKGIIAEQQAQQTARNAAEFQARGQSVKSIGQALAQNELPARAQPTTFSVGQEVMTPLWSGDMLILARRLVVNGEEYVQGCWLDWPAIRKSLLDGIKDLLPSAQLEPVKAGEKGEPSRMLAALPVRIVPGTAGAASGQPASPIIMSLVIAWGCVLVAAGAVGALLWGAVSLSERRGAFVSAVTHELRTPLTTFRMYTEMLSEGMVREESKRKGYLETLRLEAARLSHLVENVLCYARLENKRGTLAAEMMTVADLIANVEGRLRERAAQAGMELVADTGDAGGISVTVDESVVLQILFNLVDNSCKYAAGAEDKRIHLEAEARGEAAALVVRDHGPGVAKEDEKKLFKPFSKSAREAANSAPGVGLGLTLSRRLARDMGGDLALDGSADRGAAFVLTLPAGR